jgi:membrane protein
LVARQKKPKNEDRPQSGVELILAPIMGAILLTAAVIQSVRGRRQRQDQLRPVAGQEPVDADKGGIKAKLERLPVIGGVLHVHNRYGELKGNNLAAAVAFQSFLSLFPLLLVIVAGIGLFAANDETVGADIVRQLGLQGDAADIVTDAVETAATSPATAGPIGLAGLLWSGLGLVNALQYSMDQVWQVEERGMRDKLFGLGWLIGAAMLFVGASAITTALNWLPGFITPLGVVVGIAVNLALWLWSFKVLPNRELPLRALIPGAVLGALGLEAMKFIGAFYLPRMVADSSALYGSIGIVFAVLAWLLVFSRLVLYATVLNVVRWEKRAGTVEAKIEVPAGRGIQPHDDVTRSGRVEADDAAA